MVASGWIGVDLDGTLAVYKGWNNGEIGEPIPLMVERIKKWISEGVEVRVFTARVGFGGAQALQPNYFKDSMFADEQRKIIEKWCEKHIGVILPVTATKDFSMIELWDDRAVQVIPNTGKRVDGEE